MATQTVNEPEAVEDQPLNLHALYRNNTVFGYDQDLLLKRGQVWAINARLQGIASITAVLLAEGPAASLSEWMRSGLLEAVHALNSDTQAQLDKINEQTKRATA